VKTGYIVLLGIKPDHPATGYGYIKPSKNITNELMKIERFIEKPHKDLAESLIIDHCLWNAGIFFFQNNIMQEHIQTHLPDTYAITKKAVENAKKDLDFVRLDAEAFSKLTKISIDYGIIEKIDGRAVIICDDLGWSDVGDWNAVWNDSTKDKEGNSIKGDVVTHDVKNSYLRSDGLLISAIGVEDLIIVASSDAVLVVNRHQTELVKEMTISLRNNKRSEADCHKRVYRPWGFYQETDIGERFKVKRLMIKSGEKTSIQIHYHRSEHWVVVSGTASVTLGEQVKIVHENQSIYIPAGQQHAVENPGKIELHLIEVQSGSYLGEDDIVRIEDRYGRAPDVG
jgi:mannose-1-phosphate guanylyltransferase/mannose-6-phosphate isomerase